MFFDRNGNVDSHQDDFTSPGVRAGEAGPEAGLIAHSCDARSGKRRTPALAPVASTRRARRWAAIGLAAAVAAPVVSFELPRLYGQDAPPASPTPAADKDLLKTAQQQIGDRQFEAADETLSKIKTENLSDAERQSYLAAKDESSRAVRDRVLAINEFNQGEEARQANRLVEAEAHYTAAVNNRFIDEGTKKKAQEQLALIQSMKGAAPAAPAAAPAPAAEASTPAEAPTTALSINLPPKQAYILAKTEYNAGDYLSAREHFQVAKAGKYTPTIGQDPPQVYLDRLDKMDEAEMVKRTKVARAMAGHTGEGAVAAATPVAAAGPDAAAPADSASAPRTMPVTIANSPSYVGPVTVPSSPISAAAGSSPEEDLRRTAQAEEIQRQANAYKARLLVDDGRKAEQEGRQSAARDAYTQALQLDPTNQAALDGRNRMLSYLGQNTQGTAPLTRAEQRIQIEQQQIQYDFNQAVADANAAIASGDFAAAHVAFDRARAAAVSNPGIFDAQAVRRFNDTLADLNLRLQQAEESAAAQAERDRETRTIERIRRQQEEFRRQRERTVSDLIATARRLTDDGKYREALGVVDQILVLEPRNDYAIGVRPLLEDKAAFADQRRFRERWQIEAQKQLNNAEEKKIPYDDILRYPSDWPDISAIRDQTVAGEQGQNREERAVQAQLDRKLPEVKFDGVGFSDVIDFLRDVSGANIFVNWKALETAGIDRNAPVTARLYNVRFSKALQVILDSVSTPTAKLGYTIDDGVITISTGEDLSKNVITRVYDIRDLLIDIPNFTDAPDFNLQSTTDQAKQQSGGGGGGGGGGGAGTGLFGGGAAGATKEVPKTKEQLVEDITKLITDTVASDSWKDAGGSVGSLRELSGQLVVTQTPENHRLLVNLLDQLRETKSIQVTVETRFLTVQRNFLEDVGLDMDFIFNINGNWSKKLSPIAINNNSATFTQNPETSVPGTIGKTAQSLTTAATFLDDFQVNMLLRATQAQVTSTIVTAPRVTLFNGQRAYVLVATQRAYVSDLNPQVGTGTSTFDPVISVVESGVLLDVQATVSADRKYVTLTLRPQLATLIALRDFTFQNGAGSTTLGAGNLGGFGGFGGFGNGFINGGFASASPSGTIEAPELQITEVRTTVSVPDGGTLLLGGQTIAGETEKEAGVPVLSKIPGLKRLFTNRSLAKDEQILLILVRPTIIIQKEVEQRQFPLLNSRIGGG